MSPRSATADETRLETKAALWMIALAIAAFIAASYGSTEQIVIAAFVLALPAAWMLAATALTFVAVRRIGIEPYALPDEARALAAFPVRARVVHEGWWPASWLTVDFRYGMDGWTIEAPPHVVHLAARSALELTWHVSARARGRWRFDGWEVRARFPGSLVTRVLHFDDRREHEVRSAIWKLDDQAYELLAGRRRVGGRAIASPAALEEFVGLRDFRPGDDPRRIHLVSSLRLGPGELAVRELEDPEHEDVCVILDSAISARAADPSLLRYRLEKALCFSVALCKLFASRRLRVRFLAPTATSTLERTLERGRPRDFGALEAQLAVLEPATDSRASLVLADTCARAGARAIVFVTLHDAPPRLPALIAVVPARQIALMREVIA